MYYVFNRNVRIVHHRRAELLLLPMNAENNPAHDRSEHLRMLDGLSSEIGQRLRSARIEAGLSQGELGAALDYTATMISAFERVGGA